MYRVLDGFVKLPYSAGQPLIDRVVGRGRKGEGG